MLRIISRKTAVLLRKEAPLLICTSDTVKILVNLQGGSYAARPFSALGLYARHKAEKNAEKQRGKKETKKRRM